jgi:hypothetical protein
MIKKADVQSIATQKIINNTAAIASRIIARPGGGAQRETEESNQVYCVVTLKFPLCVPLQQLTPPCNIQQFTQGTFCAATSRVSHALQHINTKGQRA